jgi:hypothetical protein
MQPGKNNTEVLVNGDEVNLLTKPGLRTISFTSFIPAQVDGQGYLAARAPVHPPQFWIDFFTAMQRNRQSFVLVVTRIGLTLRMAIESFNFQWEAPDEDMHYTLELKEFRPYRTVRSRRPRRRNRRQRQPQSRPRPAERPTVGANVTVNGRLHRTSFGDCPGATERNARRRINLIDRGRPFPYQIVTNAGVWRGWVAESAVTLR